MCRLMTTFWTCCFRASPDTTIRPRRFSLTWSSGLGSTEPKKGAWQSVCSSWPSSPACPNRRCRAPFGCSDGAPWSGSPKLPRLLCRNTNCFAIGCAGEQKDTLPRSKFDVPEASPLRNTNHGPRLAVHGSRVTTHYSPLTNHYLQRLNGIFKGEARYPT